MTGLMIWSALVAIVVLGPMLGIVPPVRASKTRNYNGQFWIGRHPSCTRAIFAQEVVEWWLKWAVAALISAPVAWFAPHPIVTGKQCPA